MGYDSWGCKESDATEHARTYKTALYFRCQSQAHFSLTGHRSAVSPAPSLGSINLLELLTGLKKPAF